MRWTIGGAVVALLVTTATVVAMGEDAPAASRVRALHTADASRPAAPTALIQQVSVAGLVVDTRGDPVANAQVVVVGTNLQTLTDDRGQFRIDNVRGAQVTLRVTRIGFRAATHDVRAGATDARIELAAAVVNLDEIVVTGTPGATEKRSLGNSVARVNAADIVDVAPVTDVGQLLNARAPGVVLTQQHGTAGGGARILIRGPSSLSFSGNPLLYIDGVRVNSDPQTGPHFSNGGGAGTPQVVSRLNDIDPNDIESIEIIKGPAAATLYGTEASNGVIQIITKKGRSGRPRWGVSVRQGANWFANPEGRMLQSYTRDPVSGLADSLNIVARESARGTPLFRTGHLQGYSVNVAGGVESAQYYVGANFDRDEGVIPSNTAERFSARANLTVTPHEKFDMNTSVGLNTGETGLYSADYMGNALYSFPALVDSPTRGFLLMPSEALLATQDLSQDVDRFMGGMTFNHRPADWLSHRLSAGIDLTNQRDINLTPRVPTEYEQFFSPLGALGGKLVSRTLTELTTVDYAATVDLPIDSPLGSKTSFGAQYYRTATEFEQLSGEQFPGQGVTDVAGAAIRSATQNLVENTTVGVYFQQQFSWRDRLFLTGAVRADDNSAFGAEFDLVAYPKISASWVLNEEPFWNVGFIDALKLRAAYGQSGQQPAAFAALRTYAPVAAENDAAAGTPQAPGNPELGPERGREFELGFDAGLLNGRMGIDFTFYDQLTTDAILLSEVPPSSGFDQRQFINAGEIANRGIELLVTGRPIESSKVAWDVSLNLSTNHNNINTLGTDIPFLPWGWIPNRQQAGFPVSSYFNKIVVSADRDANGRAINLMCDGGSGPGNDRPGGPAVPCADAPPVFLGAPHYTSEAAITSHLTLFDRLRIYTLIDVKGGGKLLESQGLINCAILLNHEINVFPERFTPEQVGECQLSVTAMGTSFIQSSGYVKLRELAVSYALPDRWASAFGASRATIRVSGRNLYHWSSWSGLDPETFTSVNWLASSHTEAVLPLPVTFETAVNLTF